MPPSTFRAAFLNKVSYAPYYQPSLRQGEAYEWLIVERSGQILLVSDTKAQATGRETSAPTDLVPNNTLAAVLISPGASASTFLFMRHLPSPLQTTGSFFPADGYAKLSLMTRDGEMQLSAHGRHSCVEEVRKNRAAFIDMGAPREADTQARTWHFEAKKMAWTSEMNL